MGDLRLRVYAMIRSVPMSFWRFQQKSDKEMLSANPVTRFPILEPHIINRAPAPFATLWRAFQSRKYPTDSQRIRPGSRYTKRIFVMTQINRLYSLFN